MSSGSSSDVLGRHLQLYSLLSVVMHWDIKDLFFKNELALLCFLVSYKRNKS